MSKIYDICNYTLNNTIFKFWNFCNREFYYFVGLNKYKSQIECT